MKLFKTLLIVTFSLALFQACGDSDAATETLTNNETTTEVALPKDTMADGKVLFTGTVVDGSESLEMWVKSNDNDIIDAIDGNYVYECPNSQATFPYNVCLLAKRVKVTVELKLYNLDYNEDGNVISEIVCPDTEIDLGNINVYDLEDLSKMIKVSVKDNVKMECKSTSDDSSYFVYFYKDAVEDFENSYELYFDFQQRSVTGRIYVEEKSESEYGKTLFF